jgi:hypothetical protein
MLSIHGVVLFVNYEMQETLELVVWVFLEIWCYINYIFNCLTS